MSANVSWRGRVLGRCTSLFFCLIFLGHGLAHAQIGESLKGLRQSSLVKGHKFFQDSSWESQRVSLTTGYKMYLFLDQAKRYSFEVMTNQGGTYIYREAFSFPFKKDSSEFEKDKAVALEFIQEASGKKIEEKEFLSFLETVKGGVAGKEYKREFGDYLIKASVFHHALYSEISIRVSFKKDPK